MLRCSTIAYIQAAWHSDEMKSFALSSLLAAIALSACNCDEQPPPDNQPDPADLLRADAIELCVIYQRGFNNFLFGGGGAFRCSVTDVTPEFSEAEIAGLRESCAAPGNDTTAQFLLALTGGRVTMNVDNIKTCAAFIPEGQAAFPEACASLFVPLVAAGGACEQQWDCQDQLVCEATDIQSQSLICTTPAALNESCLPQVDIIAAPARTCAEGLTCSNFVCIEAVVAPPPAIGDPCIDTFDCGDELRCDLIDELANEGTCQARRNIGEACEQDDDCVLNLDANDNVTTACGPNNTCVTRKNDGESCDVAVDVCAQGCSTCRPSIPGAAAATCQDRGAEGAACRETEDCIHNLVCSASNTCVIGSDVGGPCANFEDCKDDSLDCVQAVCVVRPNLGQACGGANSQACIEGQCINAQCRAGVVGDPCAEDADCSATGFCNGSTCIDGPTSGACSVDGFCADGFDCGDDNVCRAIAKVGEDCIDVGCEFGLFCNAQSICEVQREAGAQCTTGDQCVSLTCVRLECGAAPASCVTDKGFFQIFVILAVLVPVRWRRRR